MMKHTLELEAQVGVKLGGLLTWAFTFPGTPYFAGYRALATNGINLPVLGAFKLLGRLAGTRLPLTSSGARALDDILMNGVRGEPDVDGMATLDGAAIQVLVWNYHDDIVTARCHAGAPDDQGSRELRIPASASRTCASTNRTATRTPSGCRKACRRARRRRRSRPCSGRWIRRCSSRTGWSRGSGWLGRVRLRSPAVRRLVGYAFSLVGADQRRVRTGG